MIVIDAKFKQGQIVYLITDEDQKPRIVVGYKIRGGHIQYLLASGINETYHFDIEISTNKNI